MIIQIVVIVTVLLLLGFFIRNTLNNLELLGREAGYGFLFTPSNYDINQHLIEYSSRSTHLRATLVGLINTGLVALCGIFLATIIGFVAGVLRLSQNFLINRIVYVFVEFSRNVPILLWILLWHGTMIHNLPHPRQAVSFSDLSFLTNRGFYVPRPLLDPNFWWVAVAALIAITGAVFFTKHSAQKTGTDWPTLPGHMDQHCDRCDTASACIFSGRIAGNTGDAGIQRVQFPGRYGADSRIYGTDFRIVSLYRCIHRGNCTGRNSSGQSWTNRSFLCTWTEAKLDHAAGHTATGAAGDRSTDDQSIPELDEKLITGDCGRIYGCRRDNRRHIPESDRTGIGMHVNCAVNLFVYFFADIGVHELVQQKNLTGRALGDTYG